MLVMDLVRRSQWPGARQALEKLASRVPGSKHYRAMLAYARAREAQMAGRIDDAILELQRALQIDPDLSLAKTTLADLQSRRK
jgi:tetratricopeptide (TPR) repeat protein